MQPCVSFVQPRWQQHHAFSSRFDLQLAQALGESAFERSLREKVVQENSSLQWEMGKLQQNLEVRGKCFAPQLCILRTVHRAKPLSV